MVIATNKKELQGINVYIKPTYSVVMPYFERGRKAMSELQRLNMKHLAHNKPTGLLSKKAQKRLTNSVNWLVASAPKKTVFDKKTRKRHVFKVNFVTLTLPGPVQEITDHKFKSVLMHSFINLCRYRYNLKNFIWKVEAQSNGKIHAHFTTDTFLPWYGIRQIWNSVLDKNGLMDTYRNKHSAMTVEDYIDRYSNNGKVDIQTLQRRFAEGLKSGWSNPNSTDVHAVHKVRDIGAYMAKYMSKNEDDRRLLKGRLWSCSYSISQANTLSVHIPFEGDLSALDCYLNPDIEHYELQPSNDPKFSNSKIGDLYFHKLEDWGTKITGFIYETYRKTLFNIRHCIDTSHFEPDIATFTRDVEKVILAPIKPIGGIYEQSTMFDNYGN